ncbi:hypothetical protein QYM36_007281, partial [Artemia franciscana]
QTQELKVFSGYVPTLAREPLNFEIRMTKWQQHMKRSLVLDSRKSFLQTHKEMIWRIQSLSKIELQGYIFNYLDIICNICSVYVVARGGRRTYGPQSKGCELHKLPFSLHVRYVLLQKGGLVDSRSQKGLGY